MARVTANPSTRRWVFKDWAGASGGGVETCGIMRWPQSCFGKAMFGKEWDRMPAANYGLFAGGFSLFLLLALRSEPGFIPIIDHANLLFHEAGHPLIGFFSSRLETYGGTIGQLTFPVILAISGWRKGKLLLFAGALVWFFENFLNI